MFQNSQAGVHDRKFCTLQEGNSNTVIYVFHGTDSFSLKLALNTLRNKLGPEETRDANTTILQPADLTPSALLHHCAFTPFLSERRMVIVQGLISISRMKRDTFGSKSVRSRPEPSSKQQGQNKGSFVDQIMAHITEIPETTDLVFLETDIIPNNINSKKLMSIAEVHEFRPLSDQALRKWITSRVLSLGSSITQAATKRLVELIGNNLWMQESEIQKLSLYCNPNIIDEIDVQTVVGQNTRTTIFAATDAILMGKNAHAITSINTLLQAGAAIPYILVMLNRQVRLLLLAQELTDEGRSLKEIGQRLDIPSDYALRKTVEQAKQITPKKLRAFHTAILKTDYSIKSGIVDDRLAVDLLITTLSFI